MCKIYHELATPFHAYTRYQAIEDGVLVDASVMAAEAGFKIPVALTSAVWNDCVEWTDEDSKRQAHQDQDGRLWDVLFMASMAARNHATNGIGLYQLYRVPRGGRRTKARRVTLKMHIGPGDQDEVVVTIMQPNED
ncbi:MAG: DUF6573 family protein [Gammaproteobacteria bacterium]